MGLTRFSHSLNWQHHLCKNAMPNPDIETLFVDHTCDQPITVSADWLCSLYYSMEMRLFYAQVCHMFHGQIFRPVPRATIPPSLLEWISNPGCVFILNAFFLRFLKDLLYHNYICQCYIILPFYFIYLKDLFWNPFHLNNFV